MSEVRIRCPWFDPQHPAAGRCHNSRGNRGPGKPDSRPWFCSDHEDQAKAISVNLKAKLKDKLLKGSYKNVEQFTEAEASTLLSKVIWIIPAKTQSSRPKIYCKEDNLALDFDTYNALVKHFFPAKLQEVEAEQQQRDSPDPAGPSTGIERLAAAAAMMEPPTQQALTPEETLQVTKRALHMYMQQQLEAPLHRAVADAMKEQDECRQREQALKDELHRSTPTYEQLLMTADTETFRMMAGNYGPALKEQTEAAAAANKRLDEALAKRTRKEFSLTSDQTFYNSCKEIQNVTEKMLQAQVSQAASPFSNEA